MFLSCITGEKKKNATHMISKSQGPTGIQAGFYCSFFLLLSFFREGGGWVGNQSSSFPPEQISWNMPKPSCTTVCWVLPQAVVSLGDSFRCNGANLSICHPEKKVPAHSPAMCLFHSVLPWPQSRGPEHLLAWFDPRW